MRIDPQNAVRQIEAIHVRHPDVGQQEQNAGLVPLVVAQPFDSVGSGRHGVTSMLQEDFDKRPNVDVIVDYQNRSALPIVCHRPGCFGQISGFADVPATKM